jgi:hypothetical protein
MAALLCRIKWKYEALAQACYVEDNEISIAVSSHLLINLFRQTRGRADYRDRDV